MASRNTASLNTAGTIEREDLSLRGKSGDDSSKRGSSRSAWRSRLANSFRRKRHEKKRSPKTPKNSSYMDDGSFVYTPAKPSPPTQALQNKHHVHTFSHRKSRQLSCPNVSVSGDIGKGVFWFCIYIVVQSFIPLSLLVMSTIYTASVFQEIVHMNDACTIYSKIIIILYSVIIFRSSDLPLWRTIMY